MTSASCPPGKAALASGLARTPWTSLVRSMERHHPMMRVVNYHGVPARLKDGLGRQLDHLLGRFRGASGFELERILREGPGDESAVVFTFDDGLANHLEVVAPLLEERGLRGIFAIPAEFPSVEPSEQARWFRERVYPVPNEEHKVAEDLRALTWNQVRELAERGHRICSHSFGHLRLDTHAPADVLEREIVESRSRLEAELGGAAEVDGFAWPGAQYDPSPEAEALARSAYTYTLWGEARPLHRGHDIHRVYRTNLEPSWPLDVVDLQLSGLADVLLAAKRARRWMRRAMTSMGSG